MKKVFLPGLVAGIAMLAVSMILTQLENIFLPSIAAEYGNIAMFRPWSDPLMSLMFVYPFLLGFILAWVWNRAKPLFVSGSVWQKGARFGLFFWLVSSIPGMFISYSSFQVSFTMILVWLAGGLINGVVSGWIFAKMNK
jgi:hypothetical protein